MAALKQVLYVIGESPDPVVRGWNAIVVWRVLADDKQETLEWLLRPIDRGTLQEELRVDLECVSPRSVGFTDSIATLGAADREQCLHQITVASYSEPESLLRLAASLIRMRRGTRMDGLPLLDCSMPYDARWIPSRMRPAHSAWARQALRDHYNKNWSADQFRWFLSGE